MNRSDAAHSDVENNQLPVPEPFLAPALFQSLFWKPRFMVDAPLTLHLPLLNWISIVLGPHRVAVLGADDGAAHFALCQALDRLGNHGLCQGFGFWRQSKTGDAAPPPTALLRHQEMLYEDLSQLETCDALEFALDRLPPAGVDLLLCDLNALPKGTQLSVETLLSYLSGSGVLVLHGTGRLHEDMTALRGITRFLAGRSHVELHTGDGLVLLTSSGKLPMPLQTLFDAAPGGQLRRDIEQVFRRCGQGFQASAKASTQADACRKAERAVAEYTSQLQETQKEHEALRAAYDLKQTRLADTQSELSDLRDAHKALSAVLDGARAAAIATTSDCDAARAEAETAKIDRDAARAEAQIAAAKANRVEAERKLRFEELAALTQVVEDLRTKLAAANAAQAKVACSTAALINDKNDLERRVTQLLKSKCWRLTAPLRALNKRVKPK